MLHHAVAVVLAQNQQLNGVGGTHHFVFQYGTLAAGQLPVHALRGHALPVCQDQNLPTLGRLHAAAAQRKLLGFLDGRPQRFCEDRKCISTGGRSLVGWGNVGAELSRGYKKDHCQVSTLQLFFRILMLA